MATRNPHQLDPELAQAINEHVSLEAESAFRYFAMASWAATRGLSGFAAWFRSEAEGELQHMQQFVDHLNARSFQATFKSLPAPKADWASPLALFEEVHELEQTLCQRIDGLIELSHGQRDHFTGSFLQQFVPQQIADAAEADEILDRLRLVGNDGPGLLQMDRELGGKAG